MKSDRLLECFATEYGRLRAVAAGTDLSATVPSCPEWTNDDLLRHVAVVYLHKVECLRRGELPQPWPPQVDGEATLPLLERGYTELAAEFARRSPGSPTYTWYAEDQTVGFWIRRMAQETVVHRVDAELGAGVAPTAIPADLAADGVAEFLDAFVGYASLAWHDTFAELLAPADGRSLRVQTGDEAWMVRATPSQVDVHPTAPGREADASVSGDPAPVLLWLWNRVGDDAVDLGGDPGVVAYYRTIFTEAGQ
jgi:uncharacterized protein (TIGR03083 family)